MSNTIRHRGPDDEGIFADARHGIALGFRRLAIVDLSALGHQPMTSSSGRFVMEFNGEIYNFEDLRSRLAALGRRFRGRSDTEVALEAFEVWGIEESLKSFNGMFAIAVWDKQRAELTLARDRIGKKPLFIYRGARTLLFASELKSLHSDPAFESSLDPESVLQYLRYMYVPAPRSIFADVEKLRPGHFVTFGPDTSFSAESRPYWSLEQEAASRPRNEQLITDADKATEIFHDLLRDAVRIRMIADVPLGALLSGGIDSSLVVGLMSEISTQPVRTFTIGFNVPEYDEAQHARQIAAHLGTDHTELYLDGNAALDVVPMLADIFDEPLADPSQIPTYLVCHLARQHVTVALTGDGGDELFGGYHRYMEGSRMIGAASRVPLPLRKFTAGLIDTVPPALWSAASSVAPKHTPRLFGDKMRKTARLLRQRDSRDMYRSLMSVWQDPAALLAKSGAAQSQARESFWSDANLLRGMMLSDQLVYLPDDLLAKVDRASMAVSLEARAPLLDYRIAEASWRLHQDLLIQRGAGKQVLRRILDRYVPREIIDRPKMGFSVPVADWMSGPLRDMAGDLLSRDSVRSFGVLSADQVTKEWNRFVQGDRSNALGLWTLVMFQAWCNRWLGDGRPAAVTTAAA